jgi:hypothetical protein
MCIRDSVGSEMCIRDRSTLLALVEEVSGHLASGLELRSGSRPVPLQ